MLQEFLYYFPIIGAEDYIKIAEVCNFIFIENLPYFDDNNSNQQQRFITLIDIFYENKVRLLASGQSVLDVEKGINPSDEVILEIKYSSGEIKKVKTLCRIDTKNELEYYKNGGILQYVLRNMI